MGRDRVGLARKEISGRVSSGPDIPESIARPVSQSEAETRRGNEGHDARVLDNLTDGRGLNLKHYLAINASFSPYLIRVLSGQLGRENPGIRKDKYHVAREYFIVYIAFS